ncbi:porin [Citrobacter portucalensis]|uniref:porin n=1 Tax=Citrobacter portucalensis TaxID=1639133 RepID=UPI00397973A1
MKVKVLSLLVPALLVAGAANAAEIYNKDGNKLDLYGKVDGLHYFSDDSSKDGDQTYMRIGFKGETQVNDQLTGYGQWEYQIQGNAPESENNSWTRVAFAGLKFADVGSFDYGRNYGVVYDVTSWTDVLPEFGGDTYGSDNFMQQRGNGFATYRNTDFFGLVDGLNFALQSKGKDLNNGLTNYGDQDILKYVDVGATYYFNKNMSTYVDYKINLLDDNQFTRDAGISTDDIVALGLVYQF